MTAAMSSRMTRPTKMANAIRVDSQGYFVFKYSDDHGMTWSSKRYNVPVREMAIDRENPYGGADPLLLECGQTDRA